MRVVRLKTFKKLCWVIFFIFYFSFAFEWNNQIQNLELLMTKRWRMKKLLLTWLTLLDILCPGNIERIQNWSTRELQNLWTVIFMKRNNDFWFHVAYMRIRRLKYAINFSLFLILVECDYFKISNIVCIMKTNFFWYLTHWINFSTRSRSGDSRIYNFSAPAISIELLTFWAFCFHCDDLLYRSKIFSYCLRFFY